MIKNLKNKKIILGVSGGIAAYKACEILRRLTDHDAEVSVVLTEAAQKFVTPLTFQSLTRQPVHTDLFNLTEESEMSHIKLADQADLVLIAPATADLIARAAMGMANDLLTTILLVTRAPVLLAPSMNVNMWEKEVVQNNLQTLQTRGVHFIEPDEGALACGWMGKGRLAEIESILEQASSLLSAKKSKAKKKTLAGKKVLINAGPTREWMDPVRFISNPSTGKMGFALAEAAAARGARVTLVAGPVTLATPHGVKRIDVQSAQEMLKNCQRHFNQSHIFIAAAAVGDYGVEKHQKQKIKKASQKLSLTLKPNVDILKTLGHAKKNGQIVVGFAAETEQLLKHAREKIKKKHLDLIVANDVSKRGIGFGSEENQVTLLSATGKKHPLKRASKLQIAEQILDQVEKILLHHQNL